MKYIIPMMNQMKFLIYLKFVKLDIGKFLNLNFSKFTKIHN